MSRDAAASTAGDGALSVNVSHGKGKAKERQLNDGDPGTSTDPVLDLGRGKQRSRERVLIITGSKDGWHDAIEEDDEDWLRDHGGDYSVLNRLRRVDLRSVRG